MAGDKQVSVKLTAYMREGIVKRAIEAAFDKEKLALAKRESALARRCYNAVVPPAVRKQVDALPDGWLSVTQRVGFSVNGLHMEFHTTEAMRVPSSNWNRLGTITDAGIVKAVDQFQVDKRDYAERRKRAEAATEAIIASCASTRHLREVWPQGVEFYKHIQPPPASHLPAAQIQELNTMLGLKRAA